MKKLNLLFTALLLMCCVGTAKAVEVTINGTNYDVITDTKQATVISGGNYSGDIVIPSEITYNNVTYSVTSIGNWAFFGCSELTSITIPNSVTSIGDLAFYDCEGLKEVHINDLTAWCNIDFGSAGNPLSYAHNLYLNNELITELVIPNGVTSIKNNAFSGCSGLTSITIPNSVKSIGNSAFYSCSGLTSITIPNSVKSIGKSAFSGCSGLTSITIPNSVTSIGNGAFHSTGWWNNQPDGLVYKDSWLLGYNGATPTGDIVIKDGTKAIGESAFYNCTGLTSITIPNSVTSIGDLAFYSCSGLTSITIPNSVTSIGNYAFRYCFGLTSITIPNSVTSIGESAFEGCSGLTSITIPNSVTSIGEQAFNNCENLADVYCLATNVPATSSDAFYNLYPENMTLHVPAEAINSYKTTAPWSSFGSIVEIFAGGEMVIDGIKYDINVNTKQATVISGGNYAGDIIIPNEITYNNVTYSVTSIGESAFYGCSELTSIVISDGVKHIGKYAFENCTSLTSADIPNSVTSIGNWAFGNCSSLTNITIPYGVTSIGTNTFGYCSSLKSIELPNSVKNISVQAFYDCTALENITIPNSVTSIGSAAFFGTAWYNNQPKGLVYAGKVLYEYKDTYSYMDPSPVVIEEGTLGIAERAFMNQGISSITIPNSIINIGDDAFRNCEKLADVYCLATNVPATKSGAFDSSYIKNMKLHVPAEAIDSYKTTAPWSSFGTIVTLNGGTVVTPKCDNPVIKYNNGEIEIECETADAEFVTKITSSDINSFYSNSIALTATYNISVYATATGHDNSDTVNATLCWIECDCSTDDNTDIINIPAKTVFVTSNNGTININCALEGEVVELYTIDAMYIGSTTIENGCATIESGLSKGDIAIIKIAEKSIKVILN